MPTSYVPYIFISTPTCVLPIDDNVQIEAYLQEHADSMWFAHGQAPTSADYMMLMPMEALTSGRTGVALGPKTRAWVEAVHAR